MPEAIISVRGLGKRYALGEVLAHNTLRDQIASASKAVMRRLSRKKEGWASAAAGKDEIWALRDVSFDVPSGEVMGVIGKNGAGKSTLLKILSQITEPTEGEVRIRGRVGSLLEVGTGFHPELSGRENIYLNGVILGMSRAEIRKRFDEIVAFAEIEKFIETPVKRYSTGMYMRLAFAVAAHLRPEILVVDEVLAVGDAAFQKKCLGKMNEVARSGRTVLFVSHNMIAVRALCTYALVLSKGRVAKLGGTEECIDLYLEENVRTTAATWARPPESPGGALVFTRLEVEIKGEQPDLILECRMELESRESHREAFLALTILDHSGTGLMQALPRLEPFIKDSPRGHAYLMTVELPPMIPGHYFATLWTGSHFDATLDEIREAIRFEIHESPTEGRTYPHYPVHGLIVPKSKVSPAD